jgi:uncharacterized protein
VITDHALYCGTVWHRREQPKVHEFSYPFWWAWINLDDIDGLLARSPWWGRRWRPVVVSSRDYLSQESGGLSARVRRQAATLGLNWEQGHVCLLSQPRLFGWLFNPLSLYWHFPDGSSEADSVIAEVHNTPWHQRHWYPLVPKADQTGWQCEHDKAFHVSPFMAMDMRYRWQLSQNHRDLSVTISNMTEQGRLFSAGVRMERVEANADSMARIIRQYGAQSMRASGAIYAHAWRLWRKGVPFHGHPGNTVKTME